MAVHSTNHVRNGCWLHLLKMRVVEVGSGEVKAPGCVSIAKEVAKVSATVILFITGPELAEGNHPGIRQDVL